MTSKYPIRLTAYEKEQVRRAKEHIDLNLHTDLTAKGVASQVDISVHKLKAGFVQLYGKSFKEYLNERRMEKAAHLLRTSNKIIYEIARDCGYKDDTTLFRPFRKWFGQTPDDYRKN